MASDEARSPYVVIRTQSTRRRLVETPSPRPRSLRHAATAPTRPETAQNQKRDHSWPRLMETSRIDGVRLPKGQRTPRQNHLVLLGLLDRRDLRQRIDLHPSTINLDLVRVHGRVRDHDLRGIRHRRDAVRRASARWRGGGQWTPAHALAFSSRLGWPMPIFLSSTKPSARYESPSCPPGFFSNWI